MNNSVSEIARMWEQTLKIIDERLQERQIFDTFFADSFIFTAKVLYYSYEPKDDRTHTEIHRRPGLGSVPFPGKPRQKHLHRGQ